MSIDIFRFNQYTANLPKNLYLVILSSATYESSVALRSRQHLVSFQPFWRGMVVLQCILICIPMVTTEKEHFCLILFSLVVAYMKCLRFCTFRGWVDLFPFFFFCKSSLYILDMTSLSSIGITNIFCVNNFNLQSIQSTDTPRGSTTGCVKLVYYRMLR